MDIKQKKSIYGGIALFLLVLFVAYIVTASRDHSKRMREIAYPLEIKGRIVEISEAGHGSLYIKLKGENHIFEIGEAHAIGAGVELMVGDSVYKKSNSECYFYLRNEAFMLQACVGTQLYDDPIEIK